MVFVVFVVIVVFVVFVSFLAEIENFYDRPDIRGWQLVLAKRWLFTECIVKM